jgi:hypothetical protein
MNGNGGNSVVDLYMVNSARQFEYVEHSCYDQELNPTEEKLVMSMGSRIENPNYDLVRLVATHRDSSKDTGKYFLKGAHIKVNDMLRDGKVRLDNSSTLDVGYLDRAFVNSDKTALELLTLLSRRDRGEGYNHAMPSVHELAYRGLSSIAKYSSSMLGKLGGNQRGLIVVSVHNPLIDAVWEHLNPANQDDYFSPGDFIHGLFKEGCCSISFCKEGNDIESQPVFWNSNTLGQLIDRLQI